MERVKVKAAQLPAIKKELMVKQGYKCPITGRDLRAMASSNVVVDHNHQTGIIRAALPRAINGMEGKIRNLCIRWGGAQTPNEVVALLKGLISYYETHKVPQTNYVHPTFLTPTEARNKKNEAARKKSAASVKASVKK
ncbi:recombination endonuclease VII [Pseudomonas phage Alpheus]|uniref:Recombination endonuclease VII n=1 Tax=Pseudomonas phage Alpheus TaxID=2163983 RepID=A0A2S1GN14_9CAUD|nr:endonuclease VII [Pseudomonas phage Alpheus]AWD90743.1 recombination endonuclease VII [Pseudomonas phage Alpheus]